MLAAAPGDARFVVIVLRGGMDGLDVVRPVGDPMFAHHRPILSTSGWQDLDGFYGVHDGLAELMPLWQAGELAFAHATSTPYRDRRSHFDGQDMLENGSGDEAGQLTDDRDGWLNRVISRLPGAHAETAFSVGRENLLLLKGEAPAMAWSPDTDLDLSPQAQLLLSKIYESDPLFHAAASQAIELSALTEPNEMGPRRGARAEALARFAAERLVEDTRIAAFSISGWDTHANQSNSLPNALSEVSAALLTLKSTLGPVWRQTAVLCLTEFGRTVRENGSRGTDHGTGGAAIFAGGALKGGKVHCDWPGLQDGALLDDRDLLPTRDVRAYAAWAMRDLLSVSRSDLERIIFPGLDMGADPRVIA
jgi:uncharacterized protein (DUF1501 family)